MGRPKTRDRGCTQAIGESIMNKGRESDGTLLGDDEALSWRRWRDQEEVEAGTVAAVWELHPTSHTCRSISVSACTSTADHE